MAGKHVAGSTTLSFKKDGTDGGALPYTQKFMPSNDRSYAEGRQARFDGLVITDNPFGADEAAAILINQQDAWICWEHGFTIATFAEFQFETAYAGAFVP